MDHYVRKRSISPARTRHFKRMILLDEENDDWRRTSSPSASSASSKASSDSEAPGSDLVDVTEKFSGFLADFLAEYSSPEKLRSPEIHPTVEDRASLKSSQTELPQADASSYVESLSQPAESPAPESWRSDHQDYSLEHSSESEQSSDDDNDDDEDDVSADDDDWEDDDVDTPGSPGTDIDMPDGLIRKGMYVTVLLRHPERSGAIPCTGKILETHDRRGKLTMRLTKSSRRTMKAVLASSAVMPRSSRSPRGQIRSPRC